MAIIENKIDAHAFISVDGPPPEILHAGIETVARRGVQGLAFWLTGKRGRTFQWRTGVDYETLASGRVAQIAYIALIGTDPVKLIWNDQDIEANEGLKYVVLDVVSGNNDLFTIKTAVGGLNAPSGAWLNAVWTLAPVEV